MSAPDLIIRGRTVVTPEAIGPASIHVTDGVITAVAGLDEGPEGCSVLDAGDRIVMPGIIDTHVHVNEPGRTQWEGFATATRAAAAGGVTTIVDMPLNSVPPTTSVSGLQEKIAATEGQRFVDVGFWGGVVPKNAPELRPMLEAGVLGFKCFLIDSGVEEFAEVGEDDVRIALERLADAGVPLLVHAELPGPIDRALAALAERIGADHRRYETFLASRPRAAEDEAIRMMIRLCRETTVPVHIVHHSSSDALSMLRAARDEGLPVTAETCPHYLHFAAENIPDGATQFKCVPPIREAANRELLWQALADGVIDQVVSDHSPCSPELKLMELGDFSRAWGGIASLQLGLSVMWTEVKKRDHGLRRLVEWMCEAPALLAGLHRHKGKLSVGYDADMVLWEPETDVHIDGAGLQHRHHVTPYHGETLQGLVTHTLLRGRTIFENGKIADRPLGRLALRSTS